MKIGIVARSDKTGLAVQTQALIRHLDPEKVLVPDMEHLNGNKTVIPEWFPNPIRWSTHVYPDLRIEHDPVVDEFLNGLDVIITCETPYSYYLFERANQLGVKSVLQYNYEFFDYMENPGLPQPTLFAAPSLWYFEEVKAKFPNSMFLPVPVDTDVFKFRKRTHLKTLLHTVGTGTGEDRNGTLPAIQAMNFVESPVSLYIKTQRPLQYSCMGNVSIDTRTYPNPQDLYANEYDALLFPRKFGGLCLPINEALACGMPVIVPDVSPQTFWIREELRVPASARRSLRTRNLIDLWEFDPALFAQKIDELCDSPSLFGELSEWAGETARSISWRNMQSQYKEVLSNL